MGLSEHLVQSNPSEERGLTCGQAGLSLSPWLWTYSINQEAARPGGEPVSTFCKERKGKVLKRRASPPNPPPPQKHQNGSHVALAEVFLPCLFEWKFPMSAPPCSSSFRLHSPTTQRFAPSFCVTFCGSSVRPCPLLSPGSSDHSFFCTSAPPQIWGLPHIALYREACILWKTDSSLRGGAVSYLPLQSHTPLHTGGTQ